MLLDLDRYNSETALARDGATLSLESLVDEMIANLDDFLSGA